MCHRLARFGAYRCALAQEAYCDRPLTLKTSYGSAAPVAQSGNWGHPVLVCIRAVQKRLYADSRQTDVCRSLRPSLFLCGSLRPSAVNPLPIIHPHPSDFCSFPAIVIFSPVI